MTGANTKEECTLQARAALAGFELVRLADGSFMVCRWGMSRPLADELAVLEFLRSVGAPE